MLKMFIPTSIYHNVFTLSDLNANSPELQNNYNKIRDVNISHITVV